MPALAMFAKYASPGEPVQVSYCARPRSITLVRPPSATRMASSSFVGMPNVRMKSAPVPRGMIASSARSAPARPFTTSFTVPSPPTATSSSAPPSTAERASSRRWPGSSEKSASPVKPSCAVRRASSGHLRPVAPPAEAGLTRKTVRAPLMLLVRRRGVEPELRHLVDRRLHLGVGDAHELVRDDDVRDGQQAPGLDLAQRAGRVHRRGLHLHAEDAALRPALVLAFVRVVEEVAGDDRADADGLAELLRGVDGAVHEFPVSRGDVRFAHEVQRGRVGRNG